MSNLFLPDCDFLRENIIRINVGATIPSQFDVTLISNWLIALEIETPSFSSDQNVAIGTTYLAFGAQLFKGILIAGNIPNFEISEFTCFEDMHASENRCHAVLKIAPIDLVPPPVYLAAAKSAFQILSLISQLELTSKNQAHIFNKLYQEVITPLRRLIPCGKSTMHILRAAHGLGIPFIHLGLGVYQLGWGSKARLIERSTSDMDSAIGVRLAHNKAITASLFKSAGIPHSEHVIVEHAANLAHGIKDIGFPLVVKPIDQECGIGVSTEINDLPMLISSFNRAKTASKSGRVLVERQIPGVCHRLFIAQGELLYAVKRHPFAIHGDGIRTISAIIDDTRWAHSSRPPWLGIVMPALDNDVITALNKQGLTPDSIPDAGERVFLRRIESTAWGGVDEEVTNQIHPDNLAIALRAAQLFRLSSAGIDIISDNISVAWHMNGAIINEINFAPLLGGGEISRSYVPIYLSRLIEGDGRIPIEEYTTHQDLWARHRELLSLGKRCYVVTPEYVLNEAGKPIAMLRKGLNQNIRSLLLNQDVDAILVFRNMTHTH